MENISIKEKQILFIGPIFHNYENIIINKIEKYGASVIFFPEVIYSWKYSFVLHLGMKAVKRFQYFHYKRILSKTNDLKFDYLFVIKGTHIPKEFIFCIRKNNPQIKCIMYQWDSNLNNPYFQNCEYFDKVFSFDYFDVNANSKIEYLPLFFTDEILTLKYSNPTIDLLFVSSYFPDRYEKLFKIEDFAIRNNLSFYFYMFIPKSTYVKEFVFGRVKNRKYLNFKTLKREIYIDCLKKSKVIIDYSHPQQTGLSMRIIEAIGAQKSIFTNNPNISKEDVYNTEKVLIIDFDNFIIPDGFIGNTINKTYNNLFQNYYIENWLSKIFS